MRIPNVCPRCRTNWIPNNESPGEHFGALSRADNKTEICSDCGGHEAVQQWLEGGCDPVSAWPVLCH